MFDPRTYWEERARRYGSSVGGWKAVCCLGAPEIYNRLIHRLQRSALRRVIEPHPRHTWLELGCGVGRWLSEFAPGVGVLCGGDVSIAMLREARSQLDASGVTNAALFQLGGGSLPFKDSSFDLTFSVTALIHITELSTLQRAVREMCRVTRPEGRIVILESFAPDSVPSPTHVRFRAEEALVGMFRESGWLVQTSRPVYFFLPGESSLARRSSRIAFRVLSPFYYCINLWGQLLSLSSSPPVQKIQSYRYERKS